MPLIAIFALAALAAAETKVDGKLTVNGKDIPIKHVYAVMYDNAEGLEDAPELRLLFADREIDPANIETPVTFNLDVLARKGNLQGIFLRFDPKAEPRGVHGAILFTPPDERTSMPFFSLSGAEAGFTELTTTAERVSGTAVYETEESSSSDMPKYSYSITFDAPISKGRPVKEKLTGAGAAKSPLAKILIGYEQALRQGDFDTAKDLATKQKFDELQAYIEQAGKEAFLEQVKQFIPDAAVREGQIKTIIVRETFATVIAEEEGSKTIMHLVKMGDAWKVN